MPSPWRSSGKELWVFRAERPEELCGMHADLVAAALTPGEQLQYVFYAPIWEGNRAPFGIPGHAASHAVAIEVDIPFVEENLMRAERFVQSPSQNNRTQKDACTLLGDTMRAAPGFFFQK